MLLFASSTFSGTGHGKYMSLGLRWGYEFGGTSTLTFKTGFGLFQYDRYSQHQEDGFPFRTFQSVSLGYRFRFGSEKHNYFFSDVQIGNVLGGMGTGIAFLKNYRGERHLSPRFSFFGGLGVWGTFDFVHDRTIHPDVGIQIILPMPFTE